MSEADANRSDAPADASVPSGLDHCVSCHTLQPGQPHATGPNLAGVFGRGIADALGYDYSPALRSRIGEWTEAELRQFLADPGNYAPGSKMPVQGLSEQEIAEAIAALKALQ